MWLSQDVSCTRNPPFPLSQVLDEEWMASARRYLHFNAVLTKVKNRVRAALRDRSMSCVADLARLLSTHASPICPSSSLVARSL